MQKALTYSTLAHALIIALAVQLMTMKASKTYYSVDLSFGGFTSVASTGEDAQTWSLPNEVITPEENKDFLKTPSRDKKQIKKPAPTPVASRPTLKQSAKPQTISASGSGTAGSGSGSGQASIGSGSGMGNFPFPSYVDTLRRKIAINWQAGFWKDNLLERKAQVTFTIRRDGSLSGAELTEKSGDTNYDLACMRGIRLAAPFPPLPESVTQDEMRIVFDFEISN